MPRLLSRSAQETRLRLDTFLMHDQFPIRRDKLRALLRASQAPAMLVTGEVNVSYLTGFTGDSSALLIGPHLEVIVTDSRYTTQLKEECPGIEVQVRKVTQPINEAIARVVKKARLRRLAYEGNRLVVESFHGLRERLPEVEWLPFGGKIESELRAIKDEFEIAQTREAVRLAERAFEVVRASLMPEATEVETAWELERVVRKFGGAGMSFPPIVAVGDRAALPHYRPQSFAVKQAPLLLIDWGAQTSSGYKSDITRTLFTGKPTKQLATVYNTVLKAQQRAIQAIRPGRKCSAIDAQARDYIDQAGFGKYFGHGLGHGIGLEIHEQPRFSPASDAQLEPGMIVTVEPGIYLPGRGGVRIEDDVLVTEEGYEVLSSLPKDFESMQIG